MTQLIVVVVIFVFFFGKALRSISRQKRILKTQLEAYRRGDYRGQMKAVEGYRRKGPELAHYFFYRGSALAQLGQFDEAEDALRRSLAIKTDPRLTSICRSELGSLFLEAGKWDQAQECFRESIAETPDRSSPHRGIAELFLRRGMRPGDALTEAQTALALDRPQARSKGELAKLNYNTNLAESLALVAWAVAANEGAEAQVDKLVNEAVAVCDPNTKPVLAEIHYFSAMAWTALAKPAEAAIHFRQAADLDPEGTYGRLAVSIGLPAGTR